MTAAEWISRARAVTDGATSGPWEETASLSVDGVRSDHVTAAEDYDVCEVPRTPQGSEDSYFIAASRTMLPAAVAAIEAVLALHVPVWCADRDSHHCAECGTDLTDATPDCPTVRALTAHLDPS